MNVHPYTTLRSSPTFLAAAPESISQNIAHVQTHLIVHVWMGLTAPPRLPHVDNTTPSETHSPKHTGPEGGTSWRMTGECSGETRASFHVLTTNTQSHGVYKSVPSCPLYSPRAPYICPAPETLTSTQTLACSSTLTNLACDQWDEVYWCVVKERAGSWFGVSEPNLAAQPNKTFFKRRNWFPPLNKTRHFGG